MATVEEISIALDDMLFLTGVHRSMRCNALEYARLLALGTPPAEVDAIHRKNLAEYKRLLGSRQRVRGNARMLTALNNGLAAAGITPREHQTLLDSLLTTANTQLALPAAQTAAAVKAVSDDILTRAKAPVLDAPVVPPPVEVVPVADASGAL